MTLHEWRGTPEQVKAWFDFFKSGYGEAARGLLVEEASRATAPANVCGVTGEVFKSNAEFILGFQMGKRYMIELMDAMKTIPVATPDLTAETERLLHDEEGMVKDAYR